MKKILIPSWCWEVNVNHHSSVALRKNKRFIPCWPPTLNFGLICDGCGSFIQIWKRETPLFFLLLGSGSRGRSILDSDGDYEVPIRASIFISLLQRSKTTPFNDGREIRLLELCLRMELLCASHWWWWPRIRVKLSIWVHIQTRIGRPVVGFIERFLVLHMFMWVVDC